MTNNRFCLSMTTLLTHDVAHSTKPSSRPKTNNQLPKKFLSLALSWAKLVRNGKILTFKVNFYVKNIQIFFKKIFIHEYLFWGKLKTSIFKPLYSLNWRPIFEDLCSTERKTYKLFKGLVIGFGPKGRLGRMCKSVGLKCGHTNHWILFLFLSILLSICWITIYGMDTCTMIFCCIHSIYIY